MGFGGLSNQFLYCIRGVSQQVIILPRAYDAYKTKLKISVSWDQYTTKQESQFGSRHKSGIYLSLHNTKIPSGTEI